MPLYKVEIERTESTEVYVEAPSASAIRLCKELPDATIECVTSASWETTDLYVSNVKQINELPKGFCNTDFTITENGELVEG